MNYVSIDQMERQDIEAALDDAFKAVTGAVPAAGRFEPVQAAPKLASADMERFERVKELAAQGMSATEVQRALGLPNGTVYHMKRDYGIKFRDGRRRAE